MHRFWIIVTLLLSMLTPFAALAQETRTQADTPLTVADTVNGTISNSQFEIFYTFEGDEGAVIVFELFATERDNDLDWPELMLYDSSNRIIADTLNDITINQATLVVELPYSGIYQLLATRDDGRTGDSVGDYVIRVLQPQQLQTGATLNDVAIGAGPVNYYMVRNDGQFRVYYEFSNGNFNPQIQAYVVEPDYAMTTLATLYGRGLSNGTIGIDGALGDIFIITVGDTPYASYYNDELRQGNYRLRLLSNE